MPVSYDVTMLCSQVTWEPVQHLLLREGKELTAECFLHSFEIDRTDMTPPEMEKMWMDRLTAAGKVSSLPPMR